MRSFYILIPTLAIANMGGANAQLQKAGAENIRSGVVQRAIAITGKRQVHSADFSSSSPSPDGDTLDEQLVAKRDFLSGLSQGFHNIFGHSSGSSSSTTDNSQGSTSNLPSVQVDKSSSQTISGGVDPNDGTAPFLGISSGNGQSLPPLDTAFGSTSSPGPLSDHPSFGILPALDTTLGNSNYGDDFIAGAYDDNLEGATSDSTGTPLDDLPFAPTAPGAFIGIPVNGGSASSLGVISPIAVPESGSNSAGSDSFSFDGVFPSPGNDPSNDSVSLDGTTPDPGQPQGAAPSFDASSPVSLSFISSGSSPAQDLGGPSGLGGLGPILGGTGSVTTLDNGDPTQDPGQVLGGGGLDGVPYIGSVVPGQSGDAPSDDDLTGILSGGGVPILSDSTSVEDTDGSTTPGNVALSDLSGGEELSVIPGPTLDYNEDSSTDGGIPFFPGSTPIENNDGSNEPNNLGGTISGGGVPYLDGSQSIQDIGSAVDPGSQRLGSLLGGGDSFGITGITGAASPGLPIPASGAQNLLPLAPTDNGPTSLPPLGYPEAAQGAGATPANPAPGIGSSPVGYAPVGYSPLGFPIAGFPYSYAPLGYAPLGAPSTNPLSSQDSQASSGNSPNPIQAPVSALPVGYQTAVTGLPLGYSPFVGFPSVGAYPAGLGGYPWGGSGYSLFGFPGYLPFSGVPSYNADASKSSGFQFPSPGSFQGFAYSNTQAAQTSTNPSANQPIGQAPVQPSSQSPAGSYPGSWPVQGLYGYPGSLGGWYVDGNGKMAFNPGPMYSGSSIPSFIPASPSSSSNPSFSAVLQELQNQFSQALVNAQTQSSNIASPDSLGTEIPTDKNDVEGDSPASVDQLD